MILDFDWIRILYIFQYILHKFFMFLGPFGWQEFYVKDIVNNLFNLLKVELNVQKCRLLVKNLNVFQQRLFLEFENQMDQVEVSSFTFVKLITNQLAKIVNFRASESVPKAHFEIFYGFINH